MHETQSTLVVTPALKLAKSNCALLYMQWSYGVTCWEIFSGGQSPYTHVRPSTLLTYLRTGQRLDIPDNLACSDEVYVIINICINMKVCGMSNITL